MCWLCAPFSHICISLEHLHRRMTVALFSLVVCVVWRDCCRGFLAWLNACCLLWSRVFDWKSRWEERRIRIEKAAVKPAGGSEGTVWKTGMSRKVWKTKKSRGAVSVRQLVGPGSGVFGCASTVQVSPLSDLPNRIAGIDLAELAPPAGHLKLLLRVGKVGAAELTEVSEHES